MGLAEQVAESMGVTVIVLVGCVVAVPRVTRTRAVEVVVYAGHPPYVAVGADVVWVFS